MLTDKQGQMLRMLDKMIFLCQNCSLYENGCAKPYWTTESKYMMIGEAPGIDEIRNNTPFIGKAGQILMETLEKNGFRREEFLIINSVNCRPVNGSRNGKPTLKQMEICHNWIRKYMKVLQPEKIIMLGSYAIQTMTNSLVKVTECNGTWLMVDGFPAMVSVHPAYTIYNESGIVLLNESIEKFKEM